MIALSIVNSPRKIAGALVAGAATSGLFASAALGLAPTANATCASIFGIGNSAECSSTLTSGALAIGAGAQAHADGSLGAALVVGTDSTATTNAGSVFNLATSLFGSGSTALAGDGISNFATNIGGTDNHVTAQGSRVNTATNILGSGNNIVTTGGAGNWARNVLGDNTTIKVTGGVANWARNFAGDHNTVTITGGEGNTARNFFGSENTATINGGIGNFARNLSFGDLNTVTVNGGNSNLATNFLGSGNQVTTQGGYFNGARNIVGSGNTFLVGGDPSSNLNFGLNLFSNNNPGLTAGPGNLNAVLNGGGGGNTISASGLLTAGFAFLGNTNTVTAGPGPLALAGSVFRDGLIVTQTGPGIAINDNPFGGAAATSGQSSTVRMANAVLNSPKTPQAASPGGPVTKPVSHRITTSVKKFKDAVNGVTGGHNGRAPKPGADSTSKKDNADSTSNNADSTSKKDK